MSAAPSRSSPRLVAAIDPDSHSSALAWAERRGKVYVLAGCQGGGSRAVPWQSITGALVWLRGTRALAELEPRDMVAVVEAQAPNGPASKDCEPLRAVRYHWQAACEIEGTPCVFVDASKWERSFLQGEDVERGAGAIKYAYQVKAKRLTSLAVNEDRCAAIGILSWYVTDVIGSSLVFD